MAGMSTYLQNKVLSWMKGTTFPGAPANTYIALLTTAPTDDSGAGAVEVSGGSYARVTITSANWGTITGGDTVPSQIANTPALNFATPSTSWGTVVAIALYDASSAGNLLFWATITSQTIASGSTVSFASGQLKVTMD